MYISRVELSPYRRETIRALSSPQIMHAAVMSSFNSFDDKGDNRVLWRIDKIGPSIYVLVQSNRKPDFNHMIDQFGRPGSGSGWETLDYDQFLSDISDGDVLRFRLKANPVHSVSALAIKSRGKVVAHVTVRQQKNWLMDRAEKCGFEFCISDDEPSFDVVSRDTLRFKRGNRDVTLGVATFEGTIRVKDSDVFRKTLCDGIGRAKAYGCGLMTVIKT